MKEIKVEVKIDVGDMYNFFMYHTYSKPTGLASIISGIALFILTVYTYGNVPKSHTMIYVIFGTLFILLNPISFYLKAYKQVKSIPIFQEPIFYIFSEEGITTKQKEESITIKWEEIQKVAASRRSMIVYVNKVRASIIPKQAIGEDYQQIVEMIRKNMEPSRVKVK